MNLEKMVKTLRSVNLNGITLTKDQRAILIAPATKVVSELDEKNVEKVQYYKIYLQELESYPFFSVTNLKYMLLENASYLKRETFSALFEAIMELQG